MVGLKIDESRGMDGDTRRTFGKLKKYVDRLAYGADSNGSVGSVVPGLPLGRRNFLHNGDFSICQRYGSPALTGAGSGAISVTGATYGPDRWQFYPISGRGTTMYSNTTNGVYGAKQTAVIDVGASGPYTPVGGDLCVWTQVIEASTACQLGLGTAQSQPITVSFECTGAGTTYICELETVTGRHCSQAFSPALGLSRRQSVTFPADPTGTPITSSNGGGLRIYFWMAAGPTFSGGAALDTTWTAAASQNTRAVGCSNIYSAAGQQFYLANVQLELGDKATPYEYRTPEQELLDCERYYRNFIMTGGVTPVFPGALESTTAAVVSAPFRVRMRTAPSISTSGTLSFYVPRIAAVQTFTIGGNRSTVDMASFSTTHGALGALGDYLYVGGNSGSSIGFSADL